MAHAGILSQNHNGLNNKLFPGKFEKRNVQRAIDKGIAFLTLSTDKELGIQTKFNGKSRKSLTNPNPIPLERFSCLLALDLLDGKVNADLGNEWHKFVASTITPAHPTVNYFFDTTLYPFADDIETTAMMYLVKFESIPQETVSNLVKLILQNTTEDGILKAYFPPRGKREDRYDPAMNATCMRLVYKLKLDANTMATEDDMMQWLTSGEYLYGTRYYKSPDTFLYYLARAVSGSHRAKGRFIKHLKENIRSRMCKTANDYPMDSAQRLLAIYYLELLQEEDLYELISQEVNSILEQQLEDGGWGCDAMYNHGNPVVYVGGREQPSMICIAALLHVSGALF